MRSVAVGVAVAVMFAACSPQLVVPPEAKLTCASDADCPRGWSCNARTLLCFRVPVAGMREAIELACAQARIDTRRWYLPALNRHDGFTELPVCGPLPVADALSNELVGLPFHTWLPTADLRRIVDTVTRAVGPVT